MTDNNNSKINSSGSTIYFLTVSVIFALVNVYIIYSKKDLESLSAHRKSDVFNIIYLLIILIGLYFINVGTSKQMCLSNDIKWTTIIYITLMPWILIFGLLYLILKAFPGWVRPFSNTIGYLIVSALGVNTTIKKLLKSSHDESDKTLKLALINIEKNFSKFINEFDIKLEDFKEFTTTLVGERFTNENCNNTDKNIIELYRHVNAKFFIGKLIWYILSGLLITTITFNFILNISCSKTIDETNDEYKLLYEESKYRPIYGTKWKKNSDCSNKTNLSEGSLFLDLIQQYSNRFTDDTDDDDEIEFSRHELRYVGIMNELPQNMYIEIDGDCFIPIE